MFVGTHVGQVSPDKTVIFRYTTATFTVSPESWALSCCADLPGNSALYVVSVRRPITLYSGFLQTSPHEIALAFDYYLCSYLTTGTGFTYRGLDFDQLSRLAPHKITPSYSQELCMEN